jgi:hypothetical protein
MDHDDSDAPRGGEPGTKPGEGSGQRINVLDTEQEGGGVEGCALERRDAVKRGHVADEEAAFAAVGAPRCFDESGATIDSDQRAAPPRDVGRERGRTTTEVEDTLARPRREEVE